MSVNKKNKYILKCQNLEKCLNQKCEQNKIPVYDLYNAATFRKNSIKIKLKNNVLENGSFENKKIRYPGNFEMDHNSKKSNVNEKIQLICIGSKPDNISNDQQKFLASSYNFRNE